VIPMSETIRLAENQRLLQARTNAASWRKWGPYLSERQWGTVREDYSPDGNAWEYFSHDQARSRAYHWGEDGLAGISDEKQILCFALALWNGRDPILKERLFGLTNSEGNHGEDVKEYYFYIDSTPTHSYMKYLYKYPQSTFPYDELVAVNKKRGRNEFEYELLDTGIFNDDRYFDVFVEYAKRSVDDILIHINVVNRGPEAAEIHVLPTLWFRNSWEGHPEITKPSLSLEQGTNRQTAIAATDAGLGKMYLYCDADGIPLFCDNETNLYRLFGRTNTWQYPKDGVNDFVVNGRKDAVNPNGIGTKAAIDYKLTIPSRKSAGVRLRLTDIKPGMIQDPFKSFFEQIEKRRGEADEFYESITPKRISKDEAATMRQALSGMLWTKQYFNYDVQRWLKEHGVEAMAGPELQMRNREWFHLADEHIISMPDKWEYPWFAAWDLAFHTLAISTVDLDFAKQQLELLLTESFLHPTGQIPAYEWNFSDVNPPVHAWAAIFLYRTEEALHGEADREFLKRCFSKLVLNFSWWVNRKDRFGKNLFEGGFLGLDNIGVFDRSASLPGGGYLEQADGTAWMSLYCQNMLEIAMELASEEHGFYEDMALKFAEHFLWIARAMNQVGTGGMWDEEDGFYYDVLRTPNGDATRLKVRSMVGLLPICATTVIEPWQRESVPRMLAVLKDRLRRMPELMDVIHPTGTGHLGFAGRGIAAVVNPVRLRRILARMLDENEFLSPYGIRALSKYHEEHPYTFNVQGQDFRVNYLPAESDSGMFGGNSNWRGPIWMPANVLLIRGLLSFYLYYGNDFKVECPTGSGRLMNLFEVSREISNRLTSIFTRDENGHRPVYGGSQKFQEDPYWKDYLLFYEYFHGDNGAGIGASHQTGWTGLVAKLIQLFGSISAEEFLAGGKRMRGVNRDLEKTKSAA
jgi:hypothetical protein